MSRTISLSLVAVLLTGCSSGPTQSDGRDTETFTLTTTVLTEQGAMSYPAGTSIPSFTVSETGPVNARATYDVDVDCEFVFYIESAASPGNAVLRTTSGSRTIRLEGELEPGTYTAGLVARDGGVSLCTGIPAGGIDFPHQIVVTHP